MATRIKRVPPDGGWGWVVVVGAACSCMIIIPIFQGFGLLFRHVFKELNMSGADVTTIINVNSAFGLLLGLMHGPMLKLMSYRKYAMIGASLAFTGFFLTSFSTTIVEFIIFYGMMNSLGFGMLMAAFSLSINSYFKERRSFASGISSTLMGLGPVLMPLLMSKFIEMYSVRGTALILSALLLHAFVAALILQPIKWHYKTVEEIVEDPKEEEALKEEDELKDTESLVASEMEGARVMTLDEAALQLPRRLSVCDEEIRRSRSNFLSKLSLHEKDIYEADSKWWSKESNSPSQLRRLKQVRKQSLGSAQSTLNEQNAREKTKWYHKVISIFDLDLLKDPIYRNIWFGMSIAFTGEINFSLLTPLILGDRDFDIEETAQIMSTIGSADIIFRLISPFVGEMIKFPARQMYMLSLAMLIVSRCALAFVYTYWETIIVAVALGVAKGFRTVYMFIVIPNHVPIEKLPSAQGLQTVLNGFLIFLFGPIVGYIRDASGSYNMIIHIVNLFSLTTIVLWSIEMLVTRKKKDTSIQMTELNEMGT